MKKKVILGLASVGLVATLAVGGTLAYFTDEDAATNTITMGKVDIDLKEYSSSPKAVEKDEDKGITYKNVVPGDNLDKDAYVTVLEDSQDAYIAVKITASSDSEAVAAKLSELEYTFAENWVAVGDGVYVYATTDENGVSSAIRVASTDERVLSLDAVKIPVKWGNEMIGAELTVDVTAFGVQAENVDATEALSILKDLATK